MLARFVAVEIPLNVDLEIALQELAVSKNDLANTKKSLRPQFDLVAGITQDEQSYSANPGQKYEFKSLYGGISFN
ncbi:MAG: hypothetical protein J6386_08855 [Candidatus Synoicihabitans palmerolidicus]|nr:hypothetical protein [Candidatus Synoicihabitans palmerolidicus]